LHLQHASANKSSTRISQSAGRVLRGLAKPSRGKERDGSQRGWPLRKRILSPSTPRLKEGGSTSFVPSPLATTYVILKSQQRGYRSSAVVVTMYKIGFVRGPWPGLIGRNLRYSRPGRPKSTYILLHIIHMYLWAEHPYHDRSSPSVSNALRKWPLGDRIPI
jgi:hypothetical protein